MIATTPRRALWFALALAACGPGRAPAQVQVATPAADSILLDDHDRDLPPIGFGQFNQDVITVRLATGPLEIRIVPLDERVLRLLANDAYDGLHLLLDRHAATIDSIARRAGIREPGVALVTFFATAQGARFDPQLLSLTVRNRLLRPIGVIPLSPRMSAQQLEVREQATGLFLLEDVIPVTEPFTVSYLGATSEDWERRLNRLDAERGRVRARAQAAGAGTR